MARILLLSGAGRYSDPWHPFAETSAIIADDLRARGHEVEIAERIEDRLRALTAGSIDLLIANIGNPNVTDNIEVPDWDQVDPERYAAAMANLLAYRDAGGALIGVHVASTSWPDEPEWARYLGGRWVRGTTMHPPGGPCTIDITDADHPVTTGLATFDSVDEKYTFLETAQVRVLASHTYDGEAQPLVWVHETPAGGRVVYSALGHDVRAYEAPEAMQIIRNAVDWTLGT